MQIVPTLNFGGNCREAIQMYEKAFNGKISCMITYGEANDPAYIPLLKENQKEYIYHSEFADEFLELSLFFKAFRALYSELICIFPCFCPYGYFTRESFCEMYLIVACHFI